ncbi:MAG: NAD(P)-binding domain-containing protein [Muribaculaceae bacterium]|nr:NAD(P)-binding domain-containing protein [Muribaculaceae bacterium]
MNIAVIGTGHMGAPIARALWQAGCIVAVHNRTAARATALAADCPGMRVADNIPEAVRGADMVILAVKPHLIISIMQQALAVAPEAVMVSLAPGIPLEQLEKAGAARVLRLMPNVAIACGEGMSFICHNAEGTAAAGKLKDALAPTGEVAIVEERLFEPAMAVASCGIAFALRYVRAATEGAVALGIAPADATGYIARTLRGAAALLETPDAHPEDLIDSITTPGGATIRGLLAMEQAGFSAAVAAGLLASCKR